MIKPQYQNTEAYNEELYQMVLVNPGNEDYYLEYKAFFSDTEWPAKWGKLLAFFGNRLEKINSWLILEGRWDLIMNNAEPDNEHVMKYYGKELALFYPERCFKVWSNNSDRIMSGGINRRDYRYAVHFLKEIAKHPGGKEIASQLAEKYRSQYPRRNAMIDELKHLR